MMEAVDLSEAERERVIRDLTQHCGDGRLTLDELEERVAEVYAATSTAEIEHALRFLPATITPPPRATTQRPAVRPSTPDDAKPFLTDDARRGGEIALKVHATVFLSVTALLVAIWFLTTPFGYFWPVWPALGMGLPLAIHAGVEKAKGGC